MINNRPLPLEDTNTNWRFETKYRINCFQYLALKNAIAPYLKSDPFTQKASAKKYLVRSLYFDTCDYKLYTEKIDGVCNRIKFRIRTYGINPDSYPDIRVEIKVRKSNVIEKYGSFIAQKQLQNFMKSRYWSPCDNAVLTEFTRYVHKWNLSPKTLIQYLREGFQSRAQEGIRLTFDHHIKSTSAKELFPKNIFWHRHHLSQIVLEIKHKNEVPSWLNELIKNFNLKVVPNSKYTNSIEFAEKSFIDSSTYFLSSRFK
jgi:SPX domain protein involved in polyphosphate accumulation